MAPAPPGPRSVSPAPVARRLAVPAPPSLSPLLPLRAPEARAGTRGVVAEGAGNPRAEAEVTTEAGAETQNGGCGVRGDAVAAGVELLERLAAEVSQRRTRLRPGTGAA